MMKKWAREVIVKRFRRRIVCIRRRIKNASRPLLGIKWWGLSSLLIGFLNPTSRSSLLCRFDFHFGLIILKIANWHCDAVIGCDKCEFVCVDWFAPVQGEQRRLHLYGEVEILRGQ